MTQRHGRGLADETIRRFGLGWSGEGRGAIAQALKGEGIGATELVAVGLMKQDDPSRPPVDLFFNRVIFPSNWELSTARAAAVIRILGTGGVSPMQMTAVGFGEFRPIRDNATSEGRAANRRVMLAILRPERAGQNLYSGIVSSPPTSGGASTRVGAPEQEVVTGFRPFATGEAPPLPSRPPIGPTVPGAGTATQAAPGSAAAAPPIGPAR